MALKYKEIMLAYSNAVEEKSPLYHQLGQHMAEDKEMKGLLSPFTGNKQFIPLFMSAVLSTLYATEHELRNYYLNFSEHPLEMDARGFEVYKSFVTSHLDEIMTLARSGNLKKNIVERSALLIPIFHYMMEQSERESFNVIELGTKAGLLLNYDWYGYTFNKNHKVGYTEDINIKMKIKGYPHDTLRPLTHPRLKYGLSSDVVRIEEEEAFNWMMSLFYPEEVKRRQNLKKARDIFLAHPVELLEGDELDLLEKTLMMMPDDEPVVIFHIHHTKNWSDEKKIALLELIQRYSATKEIYHIHHQLFGQDIFIDYTHHKVIKREKLAHLELDKMKIEWLLGQPLKL